MDGVHTTRGRSGAGTWFGSVAALLVATGSPAAAESPTWTVELRPGWMDAYGHDQHVLTIHESSSSPDPADRKTAVSLDTDAGFAYGLHAAVRRGRWAAGLRFERFLNSQLVRDYRMAAVGTGSSVTFEVASRAYTSGSPAQAVYFQTIADTEYQTWTLDLYGSYRLTESPNAFLSLDLGVTTADIDNDYRAIVGLDGVGGSRLDASANYDRMVGPLVRLVGDITRGRHGVRASLGLATLFGDNELTTSTRDYRGDPADCQFDSDGCPASSYAVSESFKKELDVALPVSELEAWYSLRLTDLIAVRAGIDATTWWDVPVQPGLAPAEGGNDDLHEDTIVTWGLMTGLAFTF